MSLPFDPDFDDCAWTDDWLYIPIVQVTPGIYETFSIKSWLMSDARICDRQIQIDPPLEVRGLVMTDGTLWMSDVPQERLMMYNNARESYGRVLVGGLGLGLYPQYAMPHVDHITIIEQHTAISEVVMPVVEVASAAYQVDIIVQIGSVESVLASEPSIRYDTIFLDTWDTLDAAHLPAVNRLRTLAVRHLAQDGRILLWGYRWMTRLFEAACHQLLEVEPEERHRWLEIMTRQRPAVWQLLLPVIEQFTGQAIDDMSAALAWCREYITQAT